MKHSKSTVRHGTPSVDLSEAEFKARARALLSAPQFEEIKAAVDAVVDVQWKLYDDSEKSPRTRLAGSGYANPEEELALDWIHAKNQIKKAKIAHDQKGAKPHFLIINASPRNEHTCPSEVSKTHRLCDHVIRKFKKKKISFEYLELNQITAEYGKQIHPCKSCVSTAMPLCHWPCSCYPNHALGQIHDWMNDIYPMWTRAHGVMIITPVHWYSPPSTLKLMMDRLVCADGGNPDPTSTKGKHAGIAKKIELKGWDFPKHLGGRIFSVITHGDSEGVGHVKASLENWLSDMGMTSAGNEANLDRYIGYYEPYASSHYDLDKDPKIFKEVEQAAELLLTEVKKIMGRKNNEAAQQEAIRRK